jgi:two-component system nitrogen regulation sensor histidine kinase NtrY
MLHVRATDLAGATLGEAFAGDPREPLARLVERGPTRDGGAETLSFPVAGTWRSFEVRMTDLPPAETGRAGRVLVFDDLTELIRAQKLATWTEAARRVAHEIKNPLTPIRLAAERLRARHRAGDEDTGELVERAVDIIVREVANMQSLVDEFAGFARMPGPSYSATRFAPLLDDVLALYRELKSGVEVRGAVEPEIGEAWVDPEQIRRVLINLLDNAVEATEAPGEVSVAIRRRDERIEIAVADTGRGIPAEDRDKLFLPYFSRKGRGSGMGLAIVQRIVADHDGTIVIEDNQPRGTVFRVSLPARGAGT